ncbi:MAG: PEP-CTERM sorting domain-containing protein [Betaproteobacteria bacterium]
MRRQLHVMAAAALLAAAPLAHADVVTSTFGTQDAFGFVTGPVSGQEFSTFNLFDCGSTGGLADCVSFETFTFIHSYTPAGTATQATLQLFTAGWGLYAPAEVWVNDVFVGSLTDGEDNTGTETAWLDTFDLTPYLASINLTGNDRVQIRVATGDPLVLDGGGLDYSILRVLSGSTGGAVPVPTTPALLLAGLAALALVRRRA